MMRQAAQRDQRADVDVPVDVRLLRQQTDLAGALHCRDGKEWPAVQRYHTAIWCAQGSQTRQQRAFARAIRPEDDRDTGPGKFATDIAQRRPSAQGEREVIEPQSHHATSRLILNSSITKNGVPILAIAMPSRTSEAEGNIRTRQSASTTSKAPASAEGISSADG